MIKNFSLSCTLIIAVVLGSGCSRQPTVPVAEFGDTVRKVMGYQIHDYEKALHPNPDAVEGSDPDRLNNVLEAHRNDVTGPEEVQRPLSISIEN